MAEKKKRSAASYKAAAKKAQATRKKNLRGNSPAKRKSTPAKRRKTTKKKGMLSAMTGVEARNAFRSMASGAVGGTLYLVYEDQVDLGVGSTPEKKGAIAVLGAYVLATMGKRPNTAAGIVGAAAYDFFKTKGLLEDSSDTQMKRMNYADPLKNVPIQLSDNQMLSLQTGEMNLSANSMDLADNQDFNYQPPYADTVFY